MKGIDYGQALDGLSQARMRSFDLLFAGSSSPCEKYAAYMWAQDVVSAIYPLIHGLEIILRNSIDAAARARFGDCWWDKTAVDSSRDNATNFRDGIAKAERALRRKWNKSERKRLGLGPTDNIPTTPPAFSHDDIIAATDFGVWRDLLSDAHATSNLALQAGYLWPVSTSKAFKKYSLFSVSPDQARLDILNAISEIKDYRNRLFHHDCIWIKHGVKDRRGAIDSIRHKITLIEKLIGSISPANSKAMAAWGLFDRARDVCSEDALTRKLSVCI